VSLLAPPIRADGNIAVAARPAPRHGDDQEHVLREVLGYDDTHIASLRATGAFGSGE